jgi:hypothetical protein
MHTDFGVEPRSAFCSCVVCLVQAVRDGTTGEQQNGRIWKEAALAQFEVISGQFPEETREGHEKISVWLAGVSVEIRTTHFSSTSPKRCWLTRCKWEDITMDVG